MNEKISKIKLELLKEEFSKQIKDSYILNLSMVVLDEFENLKTENKQLKENYERTYNENRALREKQYITDTDLIYENYILSQVINEAIEYVEKCLKQTPTENRTKTDDTLDIEYEYILKILKEEK